MPKITGDVLTVNVNVQITAAALQAIVANAKASAARKPNGTYHIDTADEVSAMISRFLEEKHFDEYVRDLVNVKPPSH